MFKDLFASYMVLSVEGVNFPLFVKRLKRAKTELFGLEKDGKRLVFRIKKSEYKKVFAISEEMCYNIQTVKTRGFAEGVKKIFLKGGLTIGIACFICCFAVASFSVTKIEIEGVPYNYARIIRDKLTECGIKEKGLVTKGGIKNAERQLLKSFDGFKYISLKKRGFYLYVTAELSEKTGKVTDKTKTNLFALVSGKIVAMSVYSGFPLKSVGDSVKKGEKIVTGEGTAGDKPYSTYVLCDVTIETEFKYEYVSEKEGEEDVAVASAMLALGESNTTKEEVTARKQKDKYVNDVKISYLYKEQN